jgi:GDPmannose 4,6-dehydratase
VAARALITGITGQDGSYLREVLEEDGTEVVGLVRPGSAAPDGVDVVRGELLDHAALRWAVAEVRPDEIFHLAAPTFVPASWDDPATAMAEIAGATAVLLRAAQEHDARIFVATSPEMFGDAGASPQDERTPMRPRSPYGVAKLAAHGLVGALRERDGLFAVSGITYNHESPRRPERFVTRKITRGAAAIALGRQERLELGDLTAVRDWSHARDVMRGAVLALRADEARDYVFASGVGRTVGDFVRTAFAAAGIPEAADTAVHVDPAFVRPPEPWPLVGDPSRARSALGWLPEVSFEELVRTMVLQDLAELEASWSS